MAAEALVEKRPHMDFTPTLEKISGFVFGRDNGEGDRFADGLLDGCKEYVDCVEGIARKVSFFFSGDKGDTVGEALRCPAIAADTAAFRRDIVGDGDTAGEGGRETLVEVPPDNIGSSSCPSTGPMTSTPCACTVANLPFISSSVLP